MTYTVESVDIAPDGPALASALAGTPNDDAVTGEIPSDLPDTLTNLAQKVTANADSPAAKAAAIQAFLRSSQFSYSTERLPGSGYQALENFLLVDHKGYCEQFASAMAMMARVVGIPSRVSVGFLPGDRDGDSWKVSIRDMHAWPELYFAGYGWVRFEPTPASVTGAAPSWTVRTSNDPGEDPSEQPSAEPTESTASQNADPSTAPTAGPTTADPGLGRRIARTVLVVASSLLLLLILAAPATIRIRRRSARFDPDELPADQVEAAWAEIRDTVLDYGGRWPSGSPRTIGRELGGRLDGGRVGVHEPRRHLGRAVPLRPITDRRERHRRVCRRSPTRSATASPRPRAERGKPSHSWCRGRCSAAVPNADRTRALATESNRAVASRSRSRCGYVGLTRTAQNRHLPHEICRGRRRFNTDRAKPTREESAGRTRR